MWVVFRVGKANGVSDVCLQVTLGDVERQGTSSILLLVVIEDRS